MLGETENIKLKDIIKLLAPKIEKLKQYDRTLDFDWFFLRDEVEPMATKIVYDKAFNIFPETGEKTREDANEDS